MARFLCYFQYSSRLFASFAQESMRPSQEDVLESAFADEILVFTLVEFVD